MENDDALLDLAPENKDGKVTKRALLEKDIEGPVCRYARTKHGMLVEKFTSPGKRSVPDDMFSCTGGFVFFIEFKAPGKTASEKQAKDHERRRTMGFEVFVVDDIEEGKRIVDEMANRVSLGL